MKNRDIAKSFQLLASLMELHGENEFRYKSYANAYLALRKVEQPLTQMNKTELGAIPNVGKTIVDKIEEISSTGKLSALEKYRDITPEGIIQLLRIRGLGPKKVLIIWKELNIESPSELLYACQENRLVKAKGFGIKTQMDIANKLQYYMDSKGKFHYAALIEEAHSLIAKITDKYPDEKTSLIGDVRRAMPEVKGIEILTTINELEYASLNIEQEAEEGTQLIYQGFPVFFHQSSNEEFGTKLFEKSCSEQFLSEILKAGQLPIDDNEVNLFHTYDCAYVEPEFREDPVTWQLAKENLLPKLIEEEDVKGVVHTHTTYSDGLHSISEMAAASKKLGYQYIVITDHSRSAFYANGLSIERLEMQWREIDELNKKDPAFKIYKGIESDILNDGNLDYEEDILKEFEIVIASIHSNLRMDIGKATERLIKAIENPYTTVIGHPTGRLLLGREGYPIDTIKVIDACAANNVIIELNANPQRLDLDWTHIPYCIKKGVKISINPDAHSVDQINYIKYGVLAARKGGLTTELCWNSKDIIMNR